MAFEFDKRKCETTRVTDSDIRFQIIQPSAGETRPTPDVDIMIELLNYAGYADLEEKLRAQGFKNDIASGVICRYTINGIIVDVKPTSDEILGFANPWHPDAHAASVEIELDNVDTFLNA